VNLNERYGALCAQLGDLILNKEKLEERIQALRDQIEVLNQVAALQKNSDPKEEPKNEG
jgi:uncharacterized small protein (DUF1192 family)